MPVLFIVLIFNSSTRRILYRVDIIESAGHQLRFDKVFWDGQFDKIEVSEDFLRKLSTGSINYYTCTW